MMTKFGYFFQIKMKIEEHFVQKDTNNYINK